MVSENLRKINAAALHLLLLSAATPALAQQANPAPSQKQEAERADETYESVDDFHIDNPIIVTAPFLRDFNIMAGASQLKGDDLAREMRGQLGEMLVKLPGVSATSFTPGASRPVLRGLQGDRIRVLTDGIGSIDVSNVSADHAVALDPLTVDRVEVLRGPAALLFGGQAIGGAVNAIDKRIPRNIPQEAVHIDGLVGYGSAAQDRSAGASVDFKLGARLVAHVDAGWRKSADLSIGGYRLAPQLRQSLLDLAAEETAEGEVEAAEEALLAANARGKVPNSAARSLSLGSGLAFIDAGGNMGISGQYFETSYGVPARPGTGHAHGGEEAEEAPVSIKLEQTRVDYRGALQLGGLFEQLRLRAAFADYTHTEFEGEEIGTVFTNQGIEARAELVQRELGGWKGASGLQYFTRDFTAVGAEAFVPPSQSTQLGVFTLQELTLAAFDLEMAGRIEKVRHRASSLGVSRSFTPVSGAIGLGFRPAKAIKIGFNLSHSERAPSAEELFSNGPHIATQAYEIGDTGFGKERGNGAEAYVRIAGKSISASLTAYQTRFIGFMIDAPDGTEIDELPVFRYTQGRARYRGLEGEISLNVAQWDKTRLVLDGVGDVVRARLGNGGGAVPRIPPLRLLGGAELNNPLWSLRMEAEWNAAQRRNASFETPTDSFLLANASASWKPFGPDGGVTLLASANNIFDVIGRRAASFTKDFVPISGRDLRISARISF